MGYYINTDSKGNDLPAIGKAEALINDGGQISGPAWKENLICVVNNGAFEAAGYMHTERELQDWTSPTDGRRKTWLTHPKAKELSGYAKHGHLENEMM